MSDRSDDVAAASTAVSGSLMSFVLLAKWLGVAADPVQILHDHGRADGRYGLEDLARIAGRLGILARLKTGTIAGFGQTPLPALLDLADDEIAILLKVEDQNGIRRYLMQRGDGARPEIWSADEMTARYRGRLLLMTTRERTTGAARPFDVSWFIPALVRYRKPLRDVLIGSFFLQLMGLVSPVFFQLVIDKVLVHQSLTTLDVLMAGLTGVLLFETLLSALRNWLFAHTTNRVDSELSAQLFRHLVNLPLSYFEARRVGDSVARVRELERIREFLTSNAVTLVIDLFFTIVFLAVMYLYSAALTLIVVLSIPAYAAISIVITPVLRRRLDEKFRRGAENQAFLVEAVTGIGTLKAMAIEPQMRERWERQFAGYTGMGFQVAALANWGSHLIQLTSKLTTVAILYAGAMAVIAGDLTVGGLVAFNMLAGRVAQPILRISQLWQDFQQVRISIANDRDVEGDSFEIVEVFDADQGTVRRDGARLIFDPAPGYVGDAGFAYRVVDSRGAASVGQVTLLVLPNVPLPIAVSDAGFEMLEDGELILDPAALMANDVTPPGSTLTFVSLDGATPMPGGLYRVTPDRDFHGDLTLLYSVENEQRIPVSSTVTIHVIPVEDAPVAGADDVVTQEDVPLVLFASVLLDNDVDVDGDALSFTRVLDTSGVTVVLRPFGEIDITPDADFAGRGWFDYEIEDSAGLTSVARVTVEVQPVNDAPVIGTVPVINLMEDQPVDFALPDGLVTDVDSPTLRVDLRGSGGTPLPPSLQFDPASGRVSGTLPADFDGRLHLVIVADDTQATSQRELVIAVLPVNDAPELIAPLPDVVSPERVPLSIPLAQGFRDVDGPGLSVTVAAAGDGPLPSWLVFDGLQLTGTPPASAAGSYEIRVTATDDSLSASDVFRLTITPAHQAPELVRPLPDVRVVEDTPVSIPLAGAFRDADGDALTYTASSAGALPLPSWLRVEGDRLFGLPPANFNGDLDVRVTASDGALSVSDDFRVSVLSVNDAPEVVVPLPDMRLANGSPISFTLAPGSFRDAEGDRLTYQATKADGSPLPSWLRLQGTTFVGQAPRNFSGTVAIAVTASDGILSASDTFLLTVMPPFPFAASSATVPRTSSTAQILALMQQDVAAFGASSGAAALVASEAPALKPVDFHA